MGIAEETQMEKDALASLTGHVKDAAGACSPGGWLATSTRNAMGYEATVTSRNMFGYWLLASWHAWTLQARGTRMAKIHAVLEARASRQQTLVARAGGMRAGLLQAQL